MSSSCIGSMICVGASKMVLLYGITHFIVVIAQERIATNGASTNISFSKGSLKVLTDRRRAS